MRLRRQIALVVGFFFAGWGGATQARDGGPTVSGTTYTFVTVDSVTAQGSLIHVTGILKGEATPSTHGAQFYYLSGNYAYAAQMIAACERKALLAMSKPGQYQLVLQDGPSAGSLESSCTLTRVNP
jgi:hypothetical protein